MQNYLYSRQVPHIKSAKGTVVWKQIPEILQSAIFAQIPPQNNS
ncbi:hypothetical protein [Anabaena lutea]|nr:hypothetical protein [Anabaena lutea]